MYCSTMNDVSQKKTIELLSLSSYGAGDGT